MATFKTHLITATTVSGLFASSLLITEMATPKVTILYWLLGILGGTLPDIDTRQSLPARFLFTGLGILIASLIVLVALKRITFFEMIMIWFIVYFLVRYGGLKLFSLFTVHRGNFHSILAAILFGLITVIVADRGFGVREFIAWFAGLSVSIGYLTHLLLDEVYSVGLTSKKPTKSSKSAFKKTSKRYKINRKFKKSAGSAFKIASKRHKKSTTFFVVAIIIAFFLTPSTDKIVKVLFHTGIDQTTGTQF